MQPRTRHWRETSSKSHKRAIPSPLALTSHLPRNCTALTGPLCPVKSPLEEADRTLAVAQVFTSNSLWVVPDIPAADESGLFATLPHRRINSLNAFRDILTGWRRCPQTILDARPLQISDTVEVIEELEFRLASFYIQPFFEASGRAPIVPHALPRTSWIV